MTVKVVLIDASLLTFCFGKTHSSSYKYHSRRSVFRDFVLSVSSLSGHRSGHHFGDSAAFYGSSVGHARGTSPAPARNRYLRRVRDTPCIFEATRDGQDESRRTTCVCVHVHVSTRARVYVLRVCRPREFVVRRPTLNILRSMTAGVGRSPARRPLAVSLACLECTPFRRVSVFGRSFRGFHLELGDLRRVRVSFSAPLGHPFGRRRLLGSKIFRRTELAREVQRSGDAPEEFCGAQFQPHGSPENNGRAGRVSARVCWCGRAGKISSPVHP